MSHYDQFEILGHISPKPAPMHWVVSGDPADIAAIERAAREIDGARLLARAEDRGFAFARFEFPPDTSYRAIGGLIFECQRRQLATAVPHPLIGHYPTGNEEDLGDPHARQPIVGVIGTVEAISVVKAQVPWADFFYVWLTDGREGQAFRPTLDRADDYHAFVQAAVVGEFTDVEIVLLVEPI